MMERGAFDGVNAAMMVHPAPGELDRMPCLAVEHYDVVYHGKEAHASAFPERGVNAADALTVAQVAIGLLRQHADHGDQVHGIVTLGGAAPNIVPALTEAKYYVRASTLETLAKWSPRVKRCFEAGAVATGATLEFVPQGPTYSEFHTDESMAGLYRANAEALGRRFPEPGGRSMSGSTDMANVSLAIPSIHPMLGIDSLPAVNHQPEFTAAAASPTADRAVTDGASAMAWTVIDVAQSDEERERLTARAYRPGELSRSEQAGLTIGSLSQGRQARQSRLARRLPDLSAAGLVDAEGLPEHVGHLAEGRLCLQRRPHRDEEVLRAAGGGGDK